MPTRKLWKGAPGSAVEPPGALPERDKKDYPEVSINGVTYRWQPGHEDGIPEEAVRIWQAYREANQ